MPIYISFGTQNLILFQIIHCSLSIFFKECWRSSAGRAADL
jgi:hypothetical protein